MKIEVKTKKIPQEEPNAMQYINAWHLWSIKKKLKLPFSKK